jgi:hypothetical protein
MGQIGSAALQVGLGLLGAGAFGGGGSAGGGETESAGRSGDYVYTQDSSGLIVRTPKSDFGGAYATGGKPPVGKVSVVGEKGPELFVPHVPGTIIPNHQLKEMTRGKPFGGFRAAGGSVDPSRAYMVGERGPEAFATIGAPGHDGASAQPYQIVNYSIDARGTDPVLTEQRTRGAIVAAHQSAIVNSVQTNDELAKRRPQR